MKEKIRQIMLYAAEKAHNTKQLPSGDFPDFVIEEPKNPIHGDLSCNLAMLMAKMQKMAPRKIAQILLDHTDDAEGIIEKKEIAGPGFINFFIRPAAWLPVLRRIHAQGDDYGRSDMGKGEKVQVEFVSANPTGPLHVGHGRGAAVGDTVANILSFCGYDVQREYYINDSGRQIRTLGTSVFIRYQQLCGKDIPLGGDCYRGDYIRDIADMIRNEKGDRLLSGDEEEAVLLCARFAADFILSGIREDLESFGVRFDRWYSEQSLFDAGKVEQVIADFREQGSLYEKDGALWFRTSDFGDEKDRVVVRSNGQTTYFASDIAYHQDKYERGLERVVDVWGADHHGYIPRMRASVMASGRKSEQFRVILIQLVSLLRDGEPVAMSSRAGEFVTLKEVVDEVGKDAARFIFLTRHYESRLDFDLELAKRKSNDNPVYYVQYVHARISSIMEKARERGITPEDWREEDLSALTEAEEIRLMKALSLYPETLETAAAMMEPHRLSYYLTDLASLFHSYYNKHKVLTDLPETTAARLCLIRAVREVIRNALSLLGVSAPEKM
ncbi:MAG: arginine--tRNA ligase [Desulfococcaceae bacterium]|jgi:arginyl-tRNA synthetase|nr:arginine--tRNA ligase [Desulfococcaceae bacterium]